MTLIYLPVYLSVQENLSLFETTLQIQHYAATAMPDTLILTWNGWHQY